MKRRSKGAQRGPRMILPDEALDRVLAQANVVASFAGRYIDALAQPTPERAGCMAQVCTQSLAVRLAGAAAETWLRRGVGLDDADVVDRIDRMLKAIGIRCAPGIASVGSAVPYAVEQARRWIQDVNDAIASRRQGGLDAMDLLANLGRAVRGLTGGSESNTHVLFVLVNGMELAVRLSFGAFPQMGTDPWSPWAPFDREQFAAVGIAAKRLGVAPVALYIFAEMYPERAVCLDRDALDRLAQAVMLERNRVQWAAVADVGRTHFGIRVEPESIEREMKRARRALLGLPQPPAAH